MRVIAVHVMQMSMSAIARPRARARWMERQEI